MSGACLVLTVGCGSSSDKKSSSAGDAGGSCEMPGAATPGAKDTHCGSKAQETSQASCHPADAGPSSGPPGYGDPMYGLEGDDDDCKYHMTWTSTPICENEDVYFTVTVTSKAGDKGPVIGASPRVDVQLGDAHLGKTVNATAVEEKPGTYKIGPVQFDQANDKWYVRFHFFETCSDAAESSPHAHAAFYVTVP